MDITNENKKEFSMEEKVANLIVELDIADRAYFAKDRQKLIKGKIEEAQQLLDTKPIDDQPDLSKKDKAHLYYLRGKTLDFLPEYTKQAEENLSKSIKLMPTKKESWDALGHVYWKKNDLQASRKCFEGSLEQDEENRETLRSLSQVCRQIPETDEKKRKDNFALSIQLANKAVGLDMKDSQSWYVLGNAHMTNFFVNHQDIAQLEKALQAYIQCEKNQVLPNPDLFFNRATILEYLERYGEAIQNYQTAFVIDPSLQSDKLASRIVDFVTKTFNIVQSRSGSTQKKHLDIVKTVPKKIEGLLKFPSHTDKDQPIAKYNVKTISELEGGQENGGNVGSILMGRILMHLDRPQDVPNSVVCVDSKNIAFVISFYGTNNTLKEKVQVGDLVYVKDPQLIFTSITFQNKMYAYQCVKVSDIRDVVINDGQPLVDIFAGAKAVITNSFN